MDLTLYICIAAVIVILVVSGLKIEQEYCRSVVFHRSEKSHPVGGGL